MTGAEPGHASAPAVPDDAGARGVHIVHAAGIIYADTVDIDNGLVGHGEAVGAADSDPRSFAGQPARGKALHRGLTALKRLGEGLDGFKIAMKTLDESRAGVGANAVGVARAAMEVATTYAKERVQFGKPIAALQAIQFMLADMAIKVDAARLLCWKAAWLYDNGMRNSRESAIAKCYAGDIAMEVTTDAVQVLGGYGYMKEYPVEKYMRDAKLHQIWEGTAQIQRIVIARQMLS